jgi:hypothetical protein
MIPFCRLPAGQRKFKNCNSPGGKLLQASRRLASHCFIGNHLSEVPFFDVSPLAVLSQVAFLVTTWIISSKLKTLINYKAHAQSLHPCHLRKNLDPEDWDALKADLAAD